MGQAGLPVPRDGGTPVRLWVAGGLRVAGCAGAAAAALALVAQAAAAWGQNVTAPGVPMWEIEGEHFTVYYPPGYETQARRVLDLAEEIRPKVARFLRWEPPRAHLALLDWEDVTNGWAVPFPRPFAALSLAPPLTWSSADAHPTEEWLRELITHEFTHLVHLDIQHGLWRLLRRLLGPVPFAYPNAYAPLWTMEGIASLAETRLTSAGRGRSALWDAHFRVAALSGKLPPIDRWSQSAHTEWPLGGETVYAFGYDLYRHVAEACGEEALPDYFHNYGTRPFPLMVNRSARQELGGRSWYAHYAEWKSAATARAKAQQVEILHRGELSARRLTHDGFWKHAPAFLPDGSLLYLAAGMDGHMGLFARAPSGETGRLADVHGGWTLSTSAQSGLAAYAALDLEDSFYVKGDLYLFDSAAKRSRRLTRNLRAASPAWAHDGRRLLATVLGTPSDRAGLAWVDASTGKATPFLDAGPQEFFWDAAVSPTGDRIACARWDERGTLDIRLLDARGGRAAEVTADRATDRFPTFSPDGRWLLFASDRSGVWNLYAVDLADPAGFSLRQVTNVVGAALQSAFSPDGRRIVYVGYAEAGFDLFEQDFDPDRFLPPAPGPSPLFHRPDAFPPLASPAPHAASGTPRRYDAFRTLGPAFWFPVPYPLGEEVGLGVVTFGIDALLTQQWLLITDWRFARNRSDHGTGGFEFSYQNHADRVDWGLGYSNQPMPKGGRVSAGGIGFGVPFATVWRSHAVGLGWGMSQFFSVPPEPNPRGTPYPTPAPDGSMGVSYSYADSHVYGRSVSPTDGRWLTASAAIGHPAVGATLRSSHVALEANEFVPLPFAHHVAALGARISRLTGRPSHALGGPPCLGAGPLPLPCVDTPGTVYDLSSMWIRGWPGGAFRGRWAVFARGQWAIPWKRVERGAGTLPVFLQRFHADIFLDWGFAADSLRGTRVPRAHASTGAELNANFMFFYGAPVKLVLGLAVPFSGALAPVPGLAPSHDLSRPRPSVYFRIVNGWF